MSFLPERNQLQGKLVLNQIIHLEPQLSLICIIRPKDVRCVLPGWMGERIGKRVRWLPNLCNTTIVENGWDADWECS